MHTDVMSDGIQNVEYSIRLSNIFYGGDPIVTSQDGEYSIDYSGISRCRNPMSISQNVEFSIRLSTISGRRKSRSETVTRGFSKSMEFLVKSWG